MFKHIKEIIKGNNPLDSKPKGMATIVDMTPEYNPLDEFKNETDK